MKLIVTCKHCLRHCKGYLMANKTDFNGEYELDLSDMYCEHCETERKSNDFPESDVLRPPEHDEFVVSFQVTL